MQLEEIQVDVLQIRGTSFRNGYIQGKQLNRELMHTFSIMEENDRNAEAVIPIYQELAPHLVDELHGLADGLAIPFLKAATLFGGYNIPKIKGMGCSSVINRDFAVRNYEFSPKLYDKRLVLIQPEEGFASIGHSLHVIGGHEGVNQGSHVCFLHEVDGA